MDSSHAFKIHPVLLFTTSSLTKGLCCDTTRPFLSPCSLQQVHMYPSAKSGPFISSIDGGIDGGSPCMSSSCPARELAIQMSYRSSDEERPGLFRALILLSPVHASRPHGRSLSNTAQSAASVKRIHGLDILSSSLCEISCHSSPTDDHARDRSHSRRHEIGSCKLYHLFVTSWDQRLEMRFGRDWLQRAWKFTARRC